MGCIRRARSKASSGGIPFDHVGEGGSHGSLICEFVHRTAGVGLIIKSLGVVPAHIVGAEIGNPLEHIAVLLLLDGMYAVFHVGIVQRNGTAKGFGVVSAASRGAGVYPKAGIAENDLVPKLVVALNVEIFDCSDSVLGLVEFPRGTGVIVEILTVDVNARLLDYLVYALGHPFKSLGIGIVEENVGVVGVGAVEQPFGMVLIEPCTGHNALGLEPKQQLNVILFALLADGGQGRWGSLPC